MIISILDPFIGMSDKSTSEIHRWFSSKGVRIFDAIFDSFQSEEPKFILTYILYAYSRDSPYIILNRDRISEKMIIAELANLPEYLQREVAEFKNSTISKAIADYLDMQGDTDFKHLCYKQDLYETILSHNIICMRKEEGKDISVKELRDNDHYASTLLEDIEKIKETYRDKYNYIYVAREEMNAAKKNDSSPGAESIEKSGFIRNN